MEAVESAHEYQDRMALLVRGEVKAIRDRIADLQRQVAAAEAEIKALSKRCPHMKTQLQSAAGSSDWRECADCGETLYDKRRA